MQKYKRLIIRLVFFIILLCIVLLPLTLQYLKSQNTEKPARIETDYLKMPDQPSDNPDYLYVNPLIDRTAESFDNKKRIVEGKQGNDNYYFDNKKYKIIENSDGGNNDTIFTFVANTDRDNYFTLPENVENVILSDWNSPVYFTAGGKLFKVYGHPTWVDLDYQQGNIPEVHQKSRSKKSPDKKSKKYGEKYEPETIYAYYEDYKDSKRYYYRGTCAVVTALNVLRRYYGKQITEFDFVKELAKKTDYIDKNIPFFIFRANLFNILGLKSYKTKDKRHKNIEWSLGGSNVFTFPEILKYKKIPFEKNGIFSKLSAEEELQMIGDKFKSNDIDTACLSINFGVLYNSSLRPIDTLTVNHQIILSGAVFKVNNNKEELTDFYVADSAGFLVEENPDPRIYSLKALSDSFDVLGAESILIDKS